MMFKYYALTATVLIALINPLSATAGSTIISEGTQFEIGALQGEIEKLARQIEDSVGIDEDIDNVILFVHGRGKHPRKSLEELIPQLEKDYDAKVVLFHWFPSFAGRLSRPEGPARASGADLKVVLESVQAYKTAHPEIFRNIKLTLLAHSMGGVVVEEYMKKFHVSGAYDAGLFDTMVLNAVDVDTKKHSEFVKKIDFAENLYVTVNNDDKILSFSAKFITNKGRLGQKLKTLGGPVDLAPNAEYIDFSDTGVNHRYYIRSGQKRNRFIERFYDQVLNGFPAKLDPTDPANGIKRVDRERIYAFRAD